MDAKLVLQEGTALYSLMHWQYQEVLVRGYFVAFGYRFLVIQDPHKPSWFTVIEEKTGRRICKGFSYRSTGAACDRALEILTEKVSENKSILEFKVTVATGLAQKVLHFQPLSSAVLSTLWK